MSSPLTVHIALVEYYGKKQIVNFELIFLCFCLQETVAFLAVREINSYCPRSYVRTVSTLDMSGVALTTDYHKRY